MFPQINSIFRKKETAEIAILKISQNSPILTQTNNDTDNTDKDENGNLIINNPKIYIYIYTQLNNIINKKPKDFIKN
ncbi:hypothetical protein ALC62_08434 [Cyphomyrmex costatus]|uniref:Uncharacterized protein n=1 Tax=Cyphomyrmex costatus TaxID=456900 RepID=A0A195CJ33_9HYME|nr:hypothetical protein ALC62_08434 [Cyphomyrmex costatus]